MTATPAPPPPDTTRTGAVWVTGTGAFLLLAAAAVFTAVRWDEIPDAAKLAALALATGAFLIAGRSLKASLPATAGALFHLGAFLVPIDVAAVGLRAELSWGALLLAEGIAGTVVFAWAAVTERSVVLRWSFAAAVVVLAAGLGATTALPFPLLLAAFSLWALLAGRTALATVWAALAGAAPLLTFVDPAGLASRQPFEQLGLIGASPRALAVVTAGLAAAVLAIAGRRRGDVGLALLGGLVAGIGATASWTGSEPAPGDTLLGLAALFVLLQAVAYATRTDAFWSIPTRVAAGIAEVVAHLATPLLLVVIVATPWLEETDGRVALATAILGLGWIAADLRSGTGRTAATIGLATAAVGTVALATTSPPAVAAALAMAAAAAVLAPTATGGHRPRPAAEVVAVTAAIGAPLVASGSSLWVTVLVGLVGTLTLTEAAVRRSSLDPTGPGSAEDLRTAWLLAIFGLIPGAVAAAVYATATDRPALALVVAAAVATLVAAQADRGRRTATGMPLGDVARGGTVALLAGAADLQPVELGLVAAVVAALSAADAVRLRRPEVALGAALALPVAIAGLTRAAGLSLPRTGVALTVGAAVIAGLGSCLGRRWLTPVATAVALSITGGLALAAADPAAFADALMITGGLGVAIAVDRGRLDGVYLAGIVVTGGVWLRLVLASVAAAEPYLLPVAVLLLIAGLRARSTGTSSWIAYGPIITVFGGSALAERIGDGAGWHALVAGAVGVLAVAAGGHRRLAAPLFLGTGLLVVLAAYETLAVTATLPTWTWLALGGSVLLGAGIAMERHDLGPMETGRRLVDVVEERFA